MTREITIKGNELQLLFNLPYPEHEFSYPMTNTPLLRYKQTTEGAKIQVLATPHSFEGKVESDLWEKEKPTWNDLLQTSLASDIITFPNLPEFKEAHKGYSKTKRLYYAPDTNILYNGFLTSSQLIEPTKVLLSGTVKDEIRARLNNKYNNHHLDELKHHGGYNRTLWDMLLNQRMKQSRKADALALPEYVQLSSQATLAESTTPTTADKEKNDAIFAQTVSSYGKQHGIFPVVLTCDAAMVDHCKLENLEYFLFQLPKTIESRQVSHKSILSFTQKLANVLGFLKIGKVTVLGEYQGRGDPDELKVIFPNGDYDWFAKHLKISRQLRELLKPNLK
jgi:hypothetical protein